MRRIATLLGVLATAAPADGQGQGQQPTISRSLERLLIRDTTITVWLFGAPDRQLEEIASLVEELGGTVRHKSRWLHAISANISTSGLTAARRRREFRHLQPVARYRGRPEPRSDAGPLGAPSMGGAQPDSVYGASAMPFRQLHLFPLVSRGVRGAGVTIAVLDTGFETELPAFDSANVVAQWDFVFNDPIVRNEPVDVPQASQHGTQTWSLLAANLPTLIIGVAPEADYLLAKTEDVRSETRVEEDHYVAALEWADSLGADIVSSSVGYLEFDDGSGYAPSDLNGDVAVTTVAADIAAARGILVVTAAGNFGPFPRSLITPADGDSVVAVGAEDSLGTLVNFSSRGPTADGRLKPDLTAPGQGVFVATAAGGFARLNGTSFSTPLIAGTAALFHEIHPIFSPIEILEALRRTGTNRDAADSSRGWGRPDGAAAVFFPLGLPIATPVDSVLTSITPTFAWSAPAMPAFALPVTYRLTVASDTTFSQILLDTALTGTSVTYTTPFAPDERPAFTVTGVAADSVTFTTAVSEHIAPPWATLTTLNDPVGSTIRDMRPLFQWTSPGVTEPPGPFTYDIQVFREDDGFVEVEAQDLSVTESAPLVDLETNTPYRWRVISRLGSDSAVTESAATFLVIDDTAPTVTLLFQNFPNPFPSRSIGRDVTCIWFDLAVAGTVRLDILNVRGHVVQNLVPGGSFPPTLQPGRYGRPAVGSPGSCDPGLEWNGTASDGTVVPRGIYLVRLHTPVGTFFKRVVFMGADFE